MANAVEHSIFSQDGQVLLQLLAAESPPADSPGTALLGGIFALAGVLIGTCGTLATERLRSRNAERSDHRKDLRSACADFSGSLVRMSHLASALSQKSNDPVTLERLAALNEEGRASFERLPLFSDPRQLQEADGLALRHVFSVRQVAAGLPDPRANEFPQEPPYQRFQRQLERFYVEARGELGLPHADGLSEPSTQFTPLMTDMRTRLRWRSGAVREPSGEASPPVVKGGNRPGLLVNPIASSPINRFR